MSQSAEDLEAKLLAILNEPETSAQVADAIEKSADGNEEGLTEEQRATLQSLLEAGLPTPEQIVQSAKCAEHNAKIQAEREAKIAARRERQAKQGNSKAKHRRR